MLAVTLAIAVQCFAAEPARDSPVTLRGAGGNFVGRIVQKLSSAYEKGRPQIKIDYRLEGNVVGVNRFQKEQLDFAALDVAAIRYEGLPKPDDYVYAPVGALVVVVVYRLDGFKADIVLDADALAGIFLGKIKTWSDDRLRHLNPDLALPDRPITAIEPSAPSSATAVFTSYLCNMSGEWKRLVGEGSTVKWPAGARTKESVSIAIRATDGTIGFELKPRASADDLKIASLRTRDTDKVDPTAEAVGLTVAEAALGTNPRADLTNISRKGSYPLVGACVLVVPRDGRARDPSVGPELKSFLEWCVTTGQDAVPKDEIYPLPESVRADAKREITKLSAE